MKSLLKRGLYRLFGIKQKANTLVPKGIESTYHPTEYPEINKWYNHIYNQKP